MSNASHKRALAARAAVRAFNAPTIAPEPVTVTSVRIYRTGKWISKRAGWTKPDGSKGGCTMQVREARAIVSTREVTRQAYQSVELTSSIGARPRYDWTRSR